MKKSKIAISLEKPILDLIDSRVDGTTLRSRSQAIEFFLEKALTEEIVTKAVIFLKGEHQKYSLEKIEGKSLLENQINLLTEAGITKVYIITQKSKYHESFIKEVRRLKTNIEVSLREVKGTGEALCSLRELLHGIDFVAMSGDILNKFNLANMIAKHKASKKIATIGLMTRNNPESFGSVVLDGELIVEFNEKSHSSRSPVVNAGIYVFSSGIFNYFDSNFVSLERDLFPKLAKSHELVGFFTYGDYIHMEEK
jgi:NDP-sugar pyrophosphorylase family protein